MRDIKTSKTGHVTISVVQKNGDRFETLAKNVVARRAQRAWRSSRVRGDTMPATEPPKLEAVWK